MRHQIVILQQQRSSDASGSAVTMVPFVSAYAKIVVVRVHSDVIKAGQVTTQLFLTISIWYQAGIFAHMQVQAMNGLYVIQSVENISELDVAVVLNCVALSQNE